MRRYGKTLLETLVVMAIIMTLAAISCPVYLRALQKARDTRDDMNTRNKNLVTDYTPERSRAAKDDPLAILK